MNVISGFWKTLKDVSIAVFKLTSQNNYDLLKVRGGATVVALGAAALNVFSIALKLLLNSDFTSC